MKTHEDLNAIVRAEYRQAALQANSGRTASCGTGTTMDLGKLDPATSTLYDAEQREALPSASLRASLGCGNPAVWAPIRPGETVLDLGSGGGIDVLLSGQRGGPSGRVYGLDMTDEMLALARDNQAKAGVTNAALAESFRVIRPGGRFAISDLVVCGQIPAEIRYRLELRCGCVAGALTEEEYFIKLVKAGFENISIEATRVYGADDAREILIGAGLNLDADASQVDGKFFSGFIRAHKPTHAQSLTAGSDDNVSPLS